MTRCAAGAAALGLALAGAGGCAASAPPPEVPWVVFASPAVQARVAAGLAREHERSGARFVRVVPVVEVEPPAPDGAASRAAEAHRALVEADAPRCLELLEGDDLVATSLAAGRRATAARVLVGRVACHVALGNADAARVQARTLAVLGLDLPDGGSSPEAESIVADAAVEVARSAPLVVDVRAGAVRAAVVLDGGAPVCATPCALPVRPGTHHLRLEADGFAPAVQVIDVSAPRTIDVALAVAPPPLAMRQWNARHASAPAPDGAESLALLSSALRRRTLLVVSARDAAGRGVVRGALLREGALAFRAERVGASEDLEAHVDEAAAELLREGGLVADESVLESPWFWVGTIGTAIAASVVTYVVLREPDTRVEARFP
jgi:hypothetical protein